MATNISGRLIQNMSAHRNMIQNKIGRNMSINTDASKPLHMYNSKTYQCNEQVIDRANYLGINLKSKHMFDGAKTRRNISQNNKGHRKTLPWKISTAQDLSKESLLPISSRRGKRAVALSPNYANFQYCERWIDSGLPVMRSTTPIPITSARAKERISQPPPPPVSSPTHPASTDRKNMSPRLDDIHMLSPRPDVSPQALRLHHEIEAMVRTRSRKNASEHLSHRVEQDYYMSGKTAAIHNRYSLDGSVDFHEQFTMEGSHHTHHVAAQEESTTASSSMYRQDYHISLMSCGCENPSPAYKTDGKTGELSNKRPTTHPSYQSPRLDYCASPSQQPAQEHYQRRTLPSSPRTSIDLHMNIPGIPGSYIIGIDSENDTNRSIPNMKLLDDQGIYYIAHNKRHPLSGDKNRAVIVYQDTSNLLCEGSKVLSDSRPDIDNDSLRQTSKSFKLQHRIKRCKSGHSERGSESGHSERRSVSGHSERGSVSGRSEKSYKTVSSERRIKSGSSEKSCKHVSSEISAKSTHSEHSCKSVSSDPNKASQIDKIDANKDIASKPVSLSFIEKDDVADVDGQPSSVVIADKNWRIGSGKGTQQHNQGRTVVKRDSIPKKVVNDVDMDYVEEQQKGSLCDVHQLPGGHDQDEPNNEVMLSEYLLESSPVTDDDIAHLCNTLNVNEKGEYLFSPTPGSVQMLGKNETLFTSIRLPLQKFVNKVKLHVLGTQTKNYVQKPEPPILPFRHNFTTNWQERPYRGASPTKEKIVDETDQIKLPKQYRIQFRKARRGDKENIIMTTKVQSGTKLTCLQQSVIGKCPQDNRNVKRKRSNADKSRKENIKRSFGKEIRDPSSLGNLSIQGRKFALKCLYKI